MTVVKRRPVQPARCVHSTSLHPAVFWILLVSLLLLVPTGALSAEKLEALVVGIGDGDSITVLDGAKVRHRVRIAGIDAPERRQAFGNVARQALASKVFRRTVTIESSERDRYGRLIGKVYVDQRDIGLSMIQAGLAWHYKAYEREQSRTDRRAYASAEREAREQGVGLWVDPSPEPPWQFRH